MKTCSRTKLLWIVLVTVVLLVVSAISASAATLPSEAQTYSGSTEEMAVAALQNAMAKVEEGYNVTLTLTTDMVFSATSAETHTIGTDTVSAGTLTITSANGSGIVIDNNTNLHFKGNVVFENVSLAKTYASVGFYGASYIIVTEGKGRFGNADGSGDVTNNLVSGYNTAAEQRKTKISVMGTDLEIYSGDYILVCPNYRASNISVSDASIVLGGDAKTEYLVGRGMYQGDGNAPSGMVTGTTNVVIQDNARADSVSVGAAKIKKASAGDSTLTIKGGTVANLSLLTYDTYYPTAGSDLSFLKSDETRSKYTLNLEGGKITGILSIANNLNNGVVSGRYFNLKDFDVVINFGATEFTGTFINGIDVYGDANLRSMTFENASSTVNFNGASIGSFIGGSRIAAASEEYAIVDDIDRVFNIDNTTFTGDMLFGSSLGTKLAEHRGDTTINVLNTNTGKVTFSDKSFFAGSHLAAEGTVHSGDISVNITTASASMLTIGANTKYMGCKVSASNTTVSGNVVGTIDPGSRMTWWIGTKTVPSVACNLVEEGISGVNISGSSDITLKRMMLSRSVYGGSVFNSPATHSQPALAENDTDKYKTKLTLEAVEFYKDQGSWDHVDMQVFGGDLINHSGVINRANSELVITSIKNQPENNNIKLFGGSNLTVANAKTYADSKITYYAKYTDAYNKPIYGGSYLNGENTLHSGDSCLDFVKGWTSIASPNVFGGSYAAQTGATHSGDSSVLIRIDSPTASSVVYGGSHLYAAGTTHSGKSNITVSGGATYVQKNAFGGSLIEGYEAGKKSVHSGESSIVIKDGIATAANFTMFGGSDIKAQNGEHSGKSSIVVENGYESSVQSVRCKGGVYGGSYLTATGAKHSGNSLVSINSANFTADCPALYGGSYIAVSGTSQTGNSKLGIYSGTLTTFTVLYGGSNFADYDAVENGDGATEKFGHLAGSAIEINGGAVNNASTVIYGGSNMNYETASIQAGIAVHGTANSTTTATVWRKSPVTMIYKSVYAGSNLGANKGFMYGDHKVYLDGEMTFNGVIAAAELLNAGSKLFGNTNLYINKNGTFFKLSSGSSAATAIAAGIYGGGQMDGNSELYMSKDVWLQEFGSFASNSKTNVKIITAGCYGTNDVDSTDVTLKTTGAAPIYGGIRQRGNVSLVIDNATGGIRTPIVVAGFRSNLGKLNGEGGNVNVEISGTIFFRYQFQVLGYGCAASDFERYSSCEGDIRVILDGGVLGDTKASMKFVCGGMNYGGDKSAGGTHMRAGFNVCKGNTYVEITDKVAFNATNPMQIIATGQYNPEGTTYIKVVGDLKLPDNSPILVSPGGDPYRIASTGTKYIDFTQVTGETPAYTNTGKGVTVYASMHNQTVSFSKFDPSKVTVLKDLSGNTLTWNGCTATYEALTAFDGVAKNKNGLLFFDVAAGKVLPNGISANTGTTLKLQCGTVYSTEFAITNALKTDILNAITSNYEVVGTSLRVGNLAMRCRAKITQEFFNAYKTVSAEKGFKIARLGMIVGINNNENYTYDIATGKTTSGTTDAWIWSDGQFNENAGNQFFMVDETKYAGYYLYAAAVSGYTTNGLINERSQIPVYFRAYIVVEDANGVQETVYINNPATKDQTNYGKSLEETARQLKVDDPTWYNSTAERKNTVDMILAGPVKQYNITLTKGAELGALSAEYLEKTAEYTRYRIIITPKDGYVVSAITVNGTGYKVNEGSYAYCNLTKDANVEVTYARKNTPELQSRREIVLNKAKGMYDVTFIYDRSYDFTHSSNYNSQHIDGYTLLKPYNGIPYSSAPAISTKSFVRDLTTRKIGDSYFVGNILAATVPVVDADGNDFTANYVWGRNCADYVYEAWSEVSSSLDLAYTQNFNENYGAVPVGYYVIDPSHYDTKGRFVSQSGLNTTKDICNENGKEVMFEAYAMLQPGDAGLCFNDTHGHALLIESIEVVTTNGKIDGAKSRINFYEQNIGGCKHKTSNDITWNTFDWFFGDGYLPLTCKELLDDKYAIAESTYTDTLAASELNGVEDVTAGKISSNYYVDRLEMVITNKATGASQIYRRYMDETQLRYFNLNEFTYDYMPQYKTLHVYEGNVFNADELTNGEYNCTLTLTLLNGKEYTVRNFDFVK